MSNPLKAVLNIRREEIPFTLSMFVYFFLVTSSFWILKPIKKTLFISFYDQTGIAFPFFHRTAAQGELYAKMANMLVAVLATIAFARLARRYRRQQLTYIFTGFFMVCYAIYYFHLRLPGDVTVWTFYLFGDLFNTLAIATFFAFLNDSVTPEASRRLYGIIVLGGVLGGVLGSTFVNAWIQRISTSNWLVICLALAAGILAAAKFAGSIVDRRPRVEQDERARSVEGFQSVERPVIVGARLVAGSPYLLSMLALVALYEFASGIADFVFTSTVSHYLDGPAIGQHLARVFTITNWVGMLVQVFVTSTVMSRAGVGPALLITPLAILATSASFLVFPVLWVGSFLNTADGGFSNSINQSAKESLYVPTTRLEKYMAKAFIDMFVQRSAKALGVLSTLMITTVFTQFSTVRWLAPIVIAVCVVWLYAARYAGGEFRKRTEERESQGCGGSPAASSDG